MLSTRTTAGCVRVCKHVYMFVNTKNTKCIHVDIFANSQKDEDSIPILVHLYVDLLRITFSPHTLIIRNSILLKLIKGAI